MKEITDFAMMFENILISCLGRPTDTVYFSSYFSDQFNARALLFAVCAKEMHINSKEYSKEEIDQICSLQNDLSKDETYSTIYKTIYFFREKMKL